VTVGSPSPASPASAGAPALWGLSPSQLHDRFWASRGVQVVRCGEPSEIVESAELFLLIDPHSLVVFRLRDMVETLSWLRPRLAIVRLRDKGHEAYREVVRTDEDGNFAEFERIYAGHESRLARIGLTPHRSVARLWQAATTSAQGWSALRRAVPPEERETRGLPGRVFDVRSDERVMAAVERLMDAWVQPSSTVPRVVRGPSGTWVDREATVARRVSVVGKVWVGAGRTLAPGEVVVGPAVLWDDPASRAVTGSVPWQELEPAHVLDRGGSRRRFRTVRLAGKRLFDVLFSLVVLALTLPLYPFIALAILLEDGWPVFFAHRRETVGGREFPCIKFRSMRKDAERVKAQLEAQNVSDGPQFFVQSDPRSTRVGRLLRATQLDELPQFLNVLLGHMSVVGPRPSPRRENQFCPEWRETRLSVRPGVTGLWQVERTRTRGLDFQEWIRFDLEYVRRMNWLLDLRIIGRTVGLVLARLFGGRGDR
jgi:lipopolysaccharide/colanic/teichoic acid biosynthesis glycosyltransferase